jgi:transcriptional regulator with XRE-family HTH domain
MSEVSHDELAARLCAFGEGLRSARTDAQLSKSAVARAAGLDRGALTRIERGIQAPKFGTLLRLARTVRRTPAELLAAVDQTKIPPSSGNHRRTGDPAKRFAKNLRLARDAAELSQKDLALDAPTDWALLSAYETGKRSPNVRSILKLSYSLDVSPTVLMHDVR